MLARILLQTARFASVVPEEEGETASSLPAGGGRICSACSPCTCNRLSTIRRACPSGARRGSDRVPSFRPALGPGARPSASQEKPVMPVDPRRAVGRAGRAARRAPRGRRDPRRLIPHPGALFRGFCQSTSGRDRVHHPRQGRPSGRKAHTAARPHRGGDSHLSVCLKLYVRVISLHAGACLLAQPSWVIAPRVRQKLA
jgi:hypothetical protein